MGPTHSAAASWVRTMSGDGWSGVGPPAGGSGWHRASGPVRPIEHLCAHLLSQCCSDNFVHDSIFDFALERNAPHAEVRTNSDRRALMGIQFRRKTEHRSVLTSPHANRAFAISGEQTYIWCKVRRRHEHRQARGGRLPSMDCLRRSRFPAAFDGCARAAACSHRLYAARRTADAAQLPGPSIAIVAIANRRRSAGSVLTLEHPP